MMKTTQIIRQAAPELARCQQACPAGIDIPRFIYLVNRGSYSEALAVIRERNLFPSVTGHACLRFCEAKCRRSEVDTPMAINALERLVVEQGSPVAVGQEAQPSGKRVAIVGSGPAGLTASYYLARLGGHSVTVFEELPELGGMMRYGIPDYRLPKDALDRDIDYIKNAGVEIRTKNRVGSLEKLQREGFDAVLLAVGAHQGRELAIPGADLDGVLDGISFLRDVCLVRDVRVGKRVVVLGGGSVAIDVARSVSRMGGKKVVILYRRTQTEMPADAEQVAQAIEEDIEIRYLVEPIKIAKQDGQLSVTCIRMKLGEPDTNGRCRPVPIQGSEFNDEFETLIYAIGQSPELGLVPKESRIIVTQQGTLEVDPVMATEQKGIFAAGDAVTGTASVIEAVAAGRKVAVSIHKYLGSKGALEEILAPPEKLKIWHGFDESILDISPSIVPLLPICERIGNFAEVKLGFDAETARRESLRCLRCDQPVSVKIEPDKCTECYACQLICSIVYQQGNCNPDKARISIGVPEYISYNKDCIGGCSLCIQHCLVEAITLSA